MLIITVENNASEITCRLNGQLVNGGVRELIRSLSTSGLKHPPPQVSFEQCFAEVRRRGDGVSVIHVKGELRAPVDSGLMQQVEGELQSGVRRVQLDLSGLTSLDAAGIGELINVLNTTTAAAARLTVVNARPRVRRMLTAVGVRELLEGGTAPRSE